MHIFTVTTTSDCESWAGNDDEVSAFNLTIFQMDDWEGLKANTFEKRQSKSAHF